MIHVAVDHADTFMYTDLSDWTGSAHAADLPPEHHWIVRWSNLAGALNKQSRAAAYSYYRYSLR